jgi:hypothetical protein
MRRTLKERDIMAVQDISGGGFRSRRVTDPLQPVYIFDGGPTEQVILPSP